MGDLVVGHLGQDLGHASGQLGEIDVAMGIDIHAAIVTDTSPDSSPGAWSRGVEAIPRATKKCFVFCQFPDTIGAIHYVIT
jgi:hypothetical protein